MASTVRVRNLGPFDRELRPDGPDTDSLATVPVGGVVEVGAALGAALAEQPDAWQIVDDTPAAAPVKGA